LLDFGDHSFHCSFLVFSLLNKKNKVLKDLRGLLAVGWGAV